MASAASPDPDTTAAPSSTTALPGITTPPGSVFLILIYVIHLLSYVTVTACTLCVNIYELSPYVRCGGSGGISNVKSLKRPLGCTTTTHPDNCNDGFFTAISRNEEREVLLSKVIKPLSTTSSPFGRAPGFSTNLGVVAIPTCSVGGYIYIEGEGWILYATPG